MPDLFIFINMSNDKISGGLSDGKTLEDIAKFHSVELKELKSQYNKGFKVELEHTNDKQMAGEIARDHLMEDPKYYDKLETIEESDMPVIKRTILTKLREHASIKIGDENPETTIYFIFDGDRPVGGIEIKNVSGSPNDDTTSIVDIRIAPKEKPLKVITDAMPLVFNTITSLNTLTLPTNPKNRAFWEKAGANRIKDGLHAFQRGH